MPLEFFVQPEGIITDTVCVDTRKKAREFCPKTVTEIFNAKYPISVCDKHTSVDWNKNQEATDARKKSKVTW